MARARNIKPGFFKNEDLAECSAWARLCFAGLWTLADRAGRLEDRAKRIKGELFPFDTIDVEPLLGELERHHFIVRYDADGIQAIQILRFSEHQSPHYSEKPSAIQAPTFRDFSHIKTPKLPESPPHDEESASREIDLRAGQPGAGAASTDETEVHHEAQTPGVDWSSSPDNSQTPGVDASLRGGRNPLNPDSLNPSSLNPDSLIPEKRALPDAGEACKAMRKAGIADVSPSNPTLVTMIAQGATIEEFRYAAARAVQANKGFAYALAIVKGDREDAARVALAPASSRSRLVSAIAGASSGEPPTHDEEEHHVPDARARH